VKASPFSECAFRKRPLNKIPKGYKQLGVSVKVVLERKEELLLALQTTVEEVLRAQDAEDQPN
jgi:hypothetical protein